MKKDEETVLVLRTCAADMTSYGGFQWPESGEVSAPDWDPDPGIECGRGLHGLLWGCGNGYLLDWSDSARWLVVSVAASDIRESRGKVRFGNGTVVYCGNREGATERLLKRAPAGSAIVGATVTAGHRGTATAGYCGTATAGDLGTATAGHLGTATAGHRGTATAGHRGTATAGYCGTATAGHLGRLQLSWWDGKRYRTAVGYIGEGDIKADVPYRLNDDHEFVQVIK